MTYTQREEREDTSTARRILRQVRFGGAARHERLVSFDLEDPNDDVLHYSITITCDDEEDDGS